jgi:hypothetical protein
MRSTADATGSKSIAVWQSASDVNAVNPLVAFYDMQSQKAQPFKKEPTSKKRFILSAKKCLQFVLIKTKKNILKGWKRETIKKFTWIID